MKICILATGYPRWKGDVSSAKNYLHTLAKSLVNNSIEVHVIAPHAKGLKKEELIDGVFIHRFQYLYPTNFQTLAYFPGIPEKIKTMKGKIQLPFFMLSMIKKMLDVVKKYGIDVINAHWAIPPGFIATFTNKLHKKPVLITLYGAELFPVIKKNSRIMKWMISYALNNAEKVVGISDVTCDAGEEISGRGNIEILPDGIDVETFNPSADEKEIKNKYGLNDYHLIFSSGRLVERKGFKYLIEALPIVSKKFPNTKLIIGGDGPEKECLENLAMNLRLKENVIFPGFIPDINFPKYMKACDVFVLPAVVDGWGDTEGSATILLEAMACGTPVVGTNVGGIPYAIKDGMGGFLVKQKDAGQLANKIIMLLEDEDLRKEMSKVGKKYVEEEFSWVKIAERYKNIFKIFIEEGYIK
jgi:glycosyltransferase involved in cell wall biosynthesis